MDMGPVVQSTVSLMKSLRRQLVKYMLTTLSNALVFYVEKKCENIFSTKNINVFVIFTFKILTEH